MPGNSRDVNDFLYKEINKQLITELIEDVGSKKRQCLLAVSNKYGLVFAAHQTGIRVYACTDFHAELPVNHKEGSATPLHHVNTGVQPSWLAVNSDNTILAALVDKPDTGTFALLFDLKAFAGQNAAAVQAYCEIRLTTSEDIHVLDLKWNPGDPYSGQLAVCSSDGAVTLWDCSKSDSYCLRAQAKTAEATCLCWSPKGKQIAIGKKDASFGQYDQLLQPKKQMPAVVVANKKYTAIDILWESTHAFFISLIDTATPDAHPDVFAVSVPKGAAPEYTCNTDICYDQKTLNKPQYYMKSLAEWNMMLCISTNSVESAVLGKCANNPAQWEQWILEESCVTVMPLLNNLKETFPLGVSVDYTSVVPLRTGRENDYYDICPILYILSNAGILISYAMLNISAGGVAKLNQSVQLLTADGVKIPKFAVVLPKPLPVKVKPVVAAPVAVAPIAVAPIAVAPVAVTPVAPVAVKSAASSPLLTSALFGATAAAATKTPPIFAGFGGIKASTPAAAAIGTPGTPIDSKPITPAASKLGSFSFGQATSLASVTSFTGSPAPAPLAATQPLARQLQFDLRTPVASSTPTTGVAVATKRLESGQKVPEAVARPLAKTVVGQAALAPAAVKHIQLTTTSSAPVVAHKPALESLPTTTTTNAALSLVKHDSAKEAPTIAKVVEIDTALYRENIMYEMQKFELDMDAVRSRTAEVMNLSLVREPVASLYSSTADHIAFINDITATTHSIASDVEELRNQVADGFTGAERAESMSTASHDDLQGQAETFIQQFDPTLKRSLEDYTSRWHSIEYALDELDDNLDSEWADYVSTKVDKKKSKINESIYSTLANNGRLIRSKKSVLKQLTHQLKSKYTMHNKTTKLADLNTSLNDSTSKLDELSSRMKAMNVRQTHSLADNLKLAERSFISPAKCEVIRQAIQCRTVNCVSSPKPSLGSPHLLDRSSILERLSLSASMIANDSRSPVSANVSKSFSATPVAAAANKPLEGFKSMSALHQVKSNLPKPGSMSMGLLPSPIATAGDQSSSSPRFSHKSAGDTFKMQPTSKTGAVNPFRSPLTTATALSAGDKPKLPSFNIPSVGLNKSDPAKVPSSPSGGTPSKSLLGSLLNGGASKSIFAMPKATDNKTSAFSFSGISTDTAKLPKDTKPASSTGFNFAAKESMATSNSSLLKASIKAEPSAFANTKLDLKDKPKTLGNFTFGLNKDANVDKKKSDSLISADNTNKEPAKAIFGGFGQKETSKPISGDNKATKSIFGGDSKTDDAKSVLVNKNEPAKPIFTSEKKTDTAKSLFGGENKSELAKSLFSGENKTDSAKPIFGGENKKTDTAKSLFGGENKSELAKSLFSGENKIDSAKPIFGGENKKEPAKPIFGGENLKEVAKTDASKDLFGTSSDNLFGSKMGLGGVPSAGSANKNIFATSTVVTSSSSGIFGTSSSAGTEKSISSGIFSSTSTTSIFGGGDAKPIGISPLTSQSAFSTSSSAAPIFASVNPLTNNKTPSIFGENQPPPAFGTNTSAAPIFGTSTTTTTKPAFGASSIAAPIFGVNTSTAAPAFGTSTSIGSVFGATTTPTPAFGATTTPIPAFGAPTSAAPTFGGSTVAAPAFGSTTAAAPAFGVTTAAAPAFGVTTAAAPAFGVNTSVASAFGAATTPTPAFGASTLTAPAFGVNTSVAPAFGATSVAAPAFGASSSATSVFGASTTAAPAFGVTSAPAFGASSTAPPAFGASSIATPAFGASSISTPAFGATSTAAPAFGATTAASPAAFGASSIGTPAFGGSPSATFGSSTFGVNATAPAFGSSAVFGSPGAFGGSAGGFGQASTNAPIFGTASSNPVKPEFGQANTMFASQPADANASGFGSLANTAQPAPSAFNFGSPAPAPTSTFGQNTSFSGNASNAFSSYR